jgi:hypothetical protein
MVARPGRLTALRVGAVLAAVIVLGGMAALAGAATKPRDQVIAHRLTLHFGDVPNGWTVHARGKNQGSACFPNALRKRRTGYSNSKDFEGSTEAQTANSSTAVHPTLALARKVYARVISSRYANCVLAQIRKAPETRNARNLRKARVAFRPDCGYQTRCSFKVAAWRISLTIQGVDVFLDYVTMLKDRAVVFFVFTDAFTPLSSFEQENMVRAVGSR